MTDQSPNQKEGTPMDLHIHTVITAAIALAQASPSSTYAHPDPETRRCFYVFDGQPSCIFGQALVKAGVPVERLAEVETQLADADGDTSIDVMLPALDVHDTPFRVMTRLTITQSLQDGGGQWRDLIPVLRLALRGLDT